MSMFIWCFLKNFFFFFNEILPAGSALLLLTATNNKEFTGKSLLTSFCAKSSEKNFRLVHHTSRTKKCCESEDRSEQFAGF